METENTHGHATCYVPSITHHYLNQKQTSMMNVTSLALLTYIKYQQLEALREEVLYMIFLDLHKAYDALDRSRCLDILEGYVVGPRYRRLLQM